ncbi:MAG: penicillin-binding protein 2 [Patescibacteria group bacterium]|nr:penicillin-binding protein 2 [Patescibacteria group bacterium]
MILKNYFNKKRQARSLEIEEVSSMREDGGEISALRKPIGEKGLLFFHYLALTVIAVLALRVFYLQVMRNDLYSQMAKENRVRYVPIRAPRGIIFDRNGEKLVNNVPSFDVVAVPADLPKDFEEREKEEKELAQMLTMNDQNLKSIVESQDFETLNPILVKENISQEEALVFSEKESRLTGFQLSKAAIREYESGEYFSPVMGYTGKITSEEFKKYPDYLMTDYIGKTGLEVSYEKYLRGENGKQKAEVDSSGKVKKDLGVEPPKNGSDLVLGLDAGLQRKIYGSLKAMTEATGTKTAAAVAIDPRNGEVLALVDVPSFENNLFARGISAEDYKNLISDESKPMFNRAVSGEYPPGSTFKPLVAAAALQEKTVNSTATVNCSGGIHIGSYNFPDWKTHGVTDIKKAIAESCDVFFYSVGGGWGDISGLGIDRIKKYANLFGLGKATGIDIPGEASGLVPDKTWKENRFGERWYVGDDYHSAIGQGFDTATPLQLANMTATIANGGTVYRPHIVRSIKKPDGSEEKKEPETIAKNFIAPSNMEIVREGMRMAVSSEQGSAKQLAALKVTVAGKTGTAQFGGEGKTHGWFVSFAPYNDPEIAMAVLVEGGGEGHSTAVPVTKEVYEWYFEERNR